MSSRESVHGRPPTMAETVRLEVDRWIERASAQERFDFMQCKLHVTLADGSHVLYQPEPGFLIVDGMRMYSAAWL